MTSAGVDMEITGSDSIFTQADIDDGLSAREILRLNTHCKYSESWKLQARGGQQTDRACDLIAKKYPEKNLRHAACYEGIKMGMYGLDSKGLPEDNPFFKRTDGCNMYSHINGQLFPEYSKCLKPEAVNDPDCQRTCYVYPNQKGCEAIVAGLSPKDRHAKLNKLGHGPKHTEISSTPPPPPGPEETVVVAASMKSVTPTAVEFSYVDPNTKKSVVAKKTLVDMYKPTDKVTVVLGKKTSKFVDLRKK
jgi:hypothetical protein